jgi:hypothetical protein
MTANALLNNNGCVKLRWLKNHIQAEKYSKIPPPHKVASENLRALVCTSLVLT